MNPNNVNNNVSNGSLDLDSIDDLFGDDNNQKPEPNKSNKAMSDDEFDELFADDYSDAKTPTDSEILDIQKELEAKFDELFGSSNND